MVRKPQTLERSAPRTADSRLGQGRRHNVPDVRCILVDGAVAAEEAAAGRVQDAAASLCNDERLD